MTFESFVRSDSNDRLGRMRVDIALRSLDVEVKGKVKFVLLFTYECP